MATILIVEDDILLAECYQRWLAHTGHHTVHVRDAQAALDAIDDARPNVVLLDMLLPGANGMQLLNMLQSHVDLVGLPVVICSNVVPAQADFSVYGVTTVLDKTTVTRQSLSAAIGSALS